MIKIPTNITEVNLQTDLEAQSQQETVSASIGSSVPTHFDELIQGGGVEAPPSKPQAAELSKDDFHALFCGLFDMGAKLTQLKSLEIDNNAGSTVACSAALYDTIQDIPALRFLLSPQGKWAGRVTAIFVFTVPMAISVRAELAARRPTVSQDAPQTAELNLSDVRF